MCKIDGFRISNPRREKRIYKNLKFCQILTEKLIPRNLIPKCLKLELNVTSRSLSRLRNPCTAALPILKVQFPEQIPQNSSYV